MDLLSIAILSEGRRECRKKKAKERKETKKKGREEEKKE